MKSAIAILGLSAVADAHGRWKCPKARDEMTEEGKHDKFENTANKVLFLDESDIHSILLCSYILFFNLIVRCLRPRVW